VLGILAFVSDMGRRERRVVGNGRGRKGEMKEGGKGKKKR